MLGILLTGRLIGFKFMGSLRGCCRELGFAGQDNIGIEATAADWQNQGLLVWSARCYSIKPHTALNRETPSLHYKTHALLFAGSLLVVNKDTELHALLDECKEVIDQRASVAEYPRAWHVTYNSTKLSF